MAEFVSVDKTSGESKQPAGESKQPAGEPKRPAGDAGKPVVSVADEACFSDLRKKVAKLQQEADKVFGAGGLTLSVDTTALVASQAWAAMDPKTRAGRPGQQNALGKLAYLLRTVVTGSHGLVKWVERGSDNRKRETPDAVKEIILSYVKSVIVCVDPTNSMSTRDLAVPDLCTCRSQTLCVTINIDDVESNSLRGHGEKLRRALSAVVLRAARVEALHKLTKVEIPNYTKQMELGEDVSCSINLDSFEPTDAFQALSPKDQETKVIRMSGCFKFALKGIVAQSSKDAEFKAKASRIKWIRMDYDPTSSISYVARGTRTTVTWKASLVEGNSESSDLGLILTQNLSETRGGLPHVKEVV